MVDDTPAITYTHTSVEKHSTCTQTSSFIDSHGVRGQTVDPLSRGALSAESRSSKHFFFFLDKQHKNVPPLHFPIDPTWEGDAGPGSGL